MTNTLAILAAVGALVASSALSYSVGVATARLHSKGTPPMNDPIKEIVDRVLAEEADDREPTAEEIALRSRK